MSQGRYRRVEANRWTFIFQGRSQTDHTYNVYTVVRIESDEKFEQCPEHAKKETCGESTYGKANDYSRI